MFCGCRLPLLLAVLLRILLLLTPEPVAAVRFDYATVTLSSPRLINAHIKNGTIHLSHDMHVSISEAGCALYASNVPVSSSSSLRATMNVGVPLRSHAEPSTLVQPKSSSLAQPTVLMTKLAGLTSPCTSSRR
jgi:hypothetical protein